VKISRTQIDQVLQALAAGQSTAASGQRRLRPVGRPGGDEVELSRASEKMRQMCEMISGLPDVRAERVAEVMAAMEKGDYSPSSIEVAEKMLGRLIADRLR